MNKNKAFLFAIVSLLLLGGGGKVMVEKTSTAQFCGSCHVMQPQYDSWSKKGPHGTLACVECHLPNTNIASHLVWKGIDGGKDFIVFHSGFSPEVIRISDHGKETVRENCVRCHGDLMIHTTEAPDCVRCHRHTHHNQLPSM